MKSKIEIISSLNKFSHELRGSTISFNFGSKDVAENHIKQLEQLKIPFDTITSSIVEIEINDLNIPFPVFYNTKQFIKEYKSVNLSNNLAILFHNDSYLVYEDGQELIKSKSISFFIKNVAATSELKKELIKISDYNNDTIHEIVFHTSTKGIFKLKYPPILPQLDDDNDYSTPITLLVNKLTDKNFQLFFKNELADFLKITTDEQFRNLIINIPNLINEADKNLELYIKNFSWETFRSKLYSEKDKYFISLREILGKIMTQLVAVPISISATVFATYKVKDPLILLLIGIAFSTYAFFIIHIQSIYYKDVKEIKNDFERDFNNIANKSGIDSATIDIEKQKIQRRIKSTFNLIYIFTSIITLLTCLFNYFLAQQFFNSIFIKFLLSLIVLLYTAFKAYYAIKN